MSAGVKRSKPYVRPAAREDCLDLAPRLREEDRQEIAHASGLPPQYALLLSFHLGTTYAVVWGDEVVALFGHIGVPGVIGVPWMLASPTLSKIRKSFLRECRRYVQEMLDTYGHLENHVWAENEVHIQWLRWLGFEFDEAAPFGINDQPFYRFYMTNQNV
jgi:hypothetical protein